MSNITAPSITLRSSKGSPLTNSEVDANFNNISAALQTGLTAASYTAADVLAKLNSVSGPTQAGGVNADTMTFGGGARSATNANTANTIVARDASGNFTASTITAATSFVGPLSSSAVTITGGTITGLSTALPIASGGTGASTQVGAQTALGLVPGTNVLAYSVAGAALAGTTAAADTAPYFTGTGTASTYSLTGYMRSLAGSADAATARSNLGLIIGTNVQAYSAELTATAGLSTNGIIVRTGAGAKVTRSISGTTGQIVVTNGDGTAGNLTISTDYNVPLLSNNNNFTGTTNSFVNLSLSGNITAVGGTFSGNITSSGNITATGAINGATVNTTSDVRLKSDIKTLNNPVDTVCLLQGVSYIKDGINQIGLIAQQVESVLPQVVSTGEDGYKSVAYGNIVGLLIEAIKEQQQTIKELTTRLEKLEK